MVKPKIDFNKVVENAKNVAEPIPIPNVKQPPPESGYRNRGRPNNGPNYHYSRVALELPVWQAMKYKKMMLDENYTDQINKALRLYLDIKK